MWNFNEGMFLPYPQTFLILQTSYILAILLGNESIFSLKSPRFIAIFVEY